MEWEKEESRERVEETSYDVQLHAPPGLETDAMHPDMTLAARGQQLFMLVIIHACTIARTCDSLHQVSPSMSGHGEASSSTDHVSPGGPRVSQILPSVQKNMLPSGVIVKYMAELAKRVNKLVEP